jgi:hypothetical protein
MGIVAVGHGAKAGEKRLAWAVEMAKSHRRQGIASVGGLWGQTFLERVYDFFPMLFSQEKYPSFPRKRESSSKASH